MLILHGFQLDSRGWILDVNPLPGIHVINQDFGVLVPISKLNGNFALIFLLCNFTPTF